VDSLLDMTWKDCISQGAASRSIQVCDSTPYQAIVCIDMLHSDNNQCSSPMILGFKALGQHESSHSVTSEWSLHFVIKAVSEINLTMTSFGSWYITPHTTSPSSASIVEWSSSHHSTIVLDDKAYFSPLMKNETGAVFPRRDAAGFFWIFSIFR
jgi:hypothetical protein